MARINEEQFAQGIDKRPEGGPSFRGAVLDALPASGGIDAEEVKKKLADKLSTFGVEEKNAKTKITQALNNLRRDSKATRTYVEGTAFYKKAPVEEKPAEGAPAQ